MQQQQQQEQRRKVLDVVAVTNILLLYPANLPGFSGNHQKLRC